MHYIILTAKCESCFGVPASWLTVPTAPTGGNLVIVITANTSTLSRSDEIIFTPTGGSGTATSTTLTITQQAISAVTYGVNSSVFAEVQVVNPTSNELVIYGLSVPVRFGLRDVSGRKVFSSILLAGAKQRISLPPFGIWGV